MLSSGCGGQRDADGEYPERPIKIIVPFGPGGGSDTFARILQQAINDDGLLDQPVVIVNVPGAGATIGSRRAKNARPDGYTILHLHDAILTAKLSGVVPYGTEAFEPIIGTGRVGLLIAVAESSSHQTLGDLVDAAQREPDSVLFAANIGAPSHFAGLMLEEQRAGAAFRYIQSGGGAKRLAALTGGHVDVSAFSTSEYKQFQSAGLRALAYFGAERHPDFPEIPTAREQGLDVLSDNIGFWWAPRGTPRDRRQVIARALERAMQAPKVRQRLDELAIEPLVFRDQQLQAQLDDKLTRMAAVAPDSTYRPPDFPRYVAIIVALMGVCLLLRGTASRRLLGREPDTAAKGDRAGFHLSRQNVGLLVYVVLITIGYVGALHADFLEYRWATALFVAAFGWVLADTGNRLRIAVGLLAVALSLGVHFAMTQFFFIDLP